MSKIIAGSFELQEQAQAAVDALAAAGFPRDQINSFYVNPAGQHDLYPLGGDENKSEGAEASDTGVVAGGATGAIIGAVAGTVGIPFTGPLGPAIGGLLGAHVGTLMGSMSQMHDDGEAQAAHHEQVVLRKGGLLVAVGVGDDEQESAALDALRRLGAHQLEHAYGTIENGDWVDFDPRQPMHLEQNQGNRPRV
jgi:hypothetical protein